MARAPLKVKRYHCGAGARRIEMPVLRTVCSSSSEAMLVASMGVAPAVPEPAASSSTR